MYRMYSLLQKNFEDKTIPTDEYKYYVVGTGHLCPDYYNEVYSQKYKNHN